MSIMYCKPPTNPDGSRKSYAARRAERRQQETEKRAQQKNETTERDPIYNATYDRRRELRRAEEQGRAEARQLAEVEEQAKRQAEIDATPEHLRRPRNEWRDLIEMRKADAWRPDVQRRMRIWQQEARKEDERIDAIMAEKLRRHELESAPEYTRAIDHWEHASQGAETDEERAEWARLKGLIEGGGANQYWEQAAPTMQARLRRVQEKIVEHAAKQAPLDEEAKALADKEKATEELQVKQEETPNEVTQ